MVKSLLHENSEKCCCQAVKQTDEPQPVHPDARGSENKSDGGIDGGRGDGVDRGIVGDGTLN